MSNKPEVFYRPDKPCAVVEILGTTRAILWPMNHPDDYNVSNNSEAMTSRVIEYDELDGKIVYVETMNTIYRIGKYD